MDFTAPIPLLKFVGTVSLGLLTGVSYTVSSITVPNLLKLKSSFSAAYALSDLTASLKLPLLTLSSLASTPFLVAYALSPRSARHPYLIYTSLLAVLSAVVPDLLLPPAASSTAAKPKPAAKKPAPKPRALDASYEVLGDIKAETASAEEEEEEEEEEVNGDHVKMEFDDTSRNFLTRTGFALAGFAIAVVGIWGDSIPKA